MDIPKRCRQTRPPLVHPTPFPTLPLRSTFAIERFDRHEKRAGKGEARRSGNLAWTVAESAGQHWSRWPICHRQKTDVRRLSSDANRTQCQCFSALREADSLGQSPVPRCCEPQHRPRTPPDRVGQAYCCRRCRRREICRPVLCSWYPVRTLGPAQNDRFQRRVPRRSAHCNRTCAKILYVIASWFTSLPDIGLKLRSGIQLCELASVDWSWSRLIPQ